VKLAEVAPRELVGEDERAPRWAVAFKFSPDRAVTRLRAITLQVGRTGVLTPVAEFDPVELGGTTVARATLHNRNEIARRDIRIGDFIEVEKAGEIIPAITGVLRERRPSGIQPYRFPAVCPACATTLVVRPDEAAVRCPNARCPAQRQRRLEHFVSGQALAIDGFGPATIAALSKAGLLQCPADFYGLRRADLVQVDGIGAKTADRLLAAVERSKRTELWRFIHGLGIPQVGASTAKILARQCRGLEALAQWSVANGREESVGPAVSALLGEFMARPENQEEIRRLLAAGVNPVAPLLTTKVNLTGKTFVFTGTLPGLTRVQATERVLAAGGRVRESVSRQTDYLVVGEGAGSKRAEAERLGVTVLSAEAFRRMVGME
jgi:DNA ligase (NAD+)